MPKVIIWNKERCAELLNIIEATGGKNIQFIPDTNDETTHVEFSISGLYEIKKEAE